MNSFRTILATAIVAGFFATVASAGIVGSAHDFATTGWAKGETCLPCHTPHGGQDATVSGPLWNHQIGTNPTYGYVTYDGSGVGTSDPTKLDPNSMLCMGCHDGTIALDSFGGTTGSTKISIKARIGDGAGNITGNHPVGSAGAYPTTDGYTASASYMVAPYIVNGLKPDPANPGKYITDSTLTQSLGKFKPLDGKYVVGCTTCHEPHNRKNQSHLLWVKNDGPLTTNAGTAVNGSGLCLSCHKK